MMLAAVSPVLIEGGLTTIAVGLALSWPEIGQGLFRPIEHALHGLAKRRGWAVATVGFTALFLRLVLIPLIPIPRPFTQDDFSFLLAANTFALGRLTNPTPAMWTHFESFHICLQPTYMSMYFPAQGLILAAGKVLTGNPWFGLLVVTSLMCAAFCWMLQAWLPPQWALLGGIIAVLHLALFSYWINTFTGAASAAALGGALILGAFPRIVHSKRSNRSALVGYGVLLAAGIVMVALSRPYEGLLLCIPVAVVVCRWMLLSPNRLKPAALLRLAVLPVLILIAAGWWMGRYDERVNGTALTLPYAVNRATYAVAPYWIWQSSRPEPAYRHKVMRDFYVGSELPIAQRIQTPLGFLAQLLAKPIMIIWFLSGIALLPPLLLLPRALRDRRIRFFVLAGCLWIPGLLIQIFLLPHYIAVFTAALYCVALQAMRHLRTCRVGGRQTGIGLIRFLILIVMIMVVFRAFASSLHLDLDTWPGTRWAFSWYGPGDFGAARARVQEQLENLPGDQLILVRYTAHHCPENEWVYNDPNIDSSKVVWAREMDESKDRDLMGHYSGRRVWLVEPDYLPAKVSPYLSAGSAMPVNDSKLSESCDATVFTAPPTASSTSDRAAK